MSAPAGERSGGIAYWLRKRKPSYILARIGKLLRRYGLTPTKAKRRTLRFVQLLARYECAPTLAAPGMVVAKHPKFMRDLRDAGVELALHGFDHVDFRSLTQPDAHGQFARAASAYRDAGIPFTGFRCPYLSYSHDMNALVPEDLVDYSSNEAVWWEVVSNTDGDHRNVIFDSLVDFYRATPADASLVLPRTVGRFVEIPVSLPDDLQLLDGLGAGDAGVRKAWVDMLRRSHDKASIFVVLFHPESFDLCAGALEGLLAEARRLDPAVWVARLGDIAAWWRELGTFEANRTNSSVELECSDRALVLARGLPNVAGREWSNGYHVVASRSLDVGSGPLPFVGAPASVAQERVATLRGLGYVVEHGGTRDCAVHLDADAVEQAATDRELVELVEQADGPLLRFWHWPSGFKSALCVTGDLDALSLLDYASRLLTL